MLLLRVSPVNGLLPGVCVPAGNQGLLLSELATYPAAYGATHPLVLTVGASGVLDEWLDYSSWDPQV